MEHCATFHLEARQFVKGTKLVCFCFQAPLLLSAMGIVRGLHKGMKVAMVTSS